VCRPAIAIEDRRNLVFLDLLQCPVASTQLGKKQLPRSLQTTLHDTLYGNPEE
jgi:hypothetical protein